MKESLKSMLNNLINDKSEEASVDFHNYITAKMKEVAGFSSEPINQIDEGTRLSKLPSHGNPFILYFSGDSLGNVEEKLAKNGYEFMCDLSGRPTSASDRKKLSPAALKAMGVRDEDIDNVKENGGWPLHQYLVFSKTEMSPSEAVEFMNSRAESISNPEKFAEVTYL